MVEEDVEVEDEEEKEEDEVDEIDETEKEEETEVKKKPVPQKVCFLCCLVLFSSCFVYFSSFLTRHYSPTQRNPCKAQHQ